MNVSKLNGSIKMRREFLRGAEMLGLRTERKGLKAQQLLFADAANAAVQRLGVLFPRRSAKTTSIWALILGRCASREEYLVGYTACTTGQKARDRFLKDVAMVLKRRYREDSKGHYTAVLEDGAEIGFRVLEGKGSERIVFDNGSILQIGPPFGETFRSDAYDLVVLDEGGEADPEMGVDLLAGILPTFDTRPDAQLIVAGTAAKYRKGNILWDTLELGREKADDVGIVEFAAPDATSEEDLNDWALVEKLVRKAHPGIGTLTDIDTIRKRWAPGGLPREQFAREYLSIFGTAGGASGIVDFEKFANGALEGAQPEPPERFTLAIAVHPLQTSSCIVAVWREDGIARIAVLEHRAGVDWLVKRSLELARKYRTAIVHDTIGPITVEAEALARARPSVKLLPQRFPEVKTAAALIVKEISLGKVAHWNQEELVTAAQLAQKRSTGATSWALGRRHGFEEDDIICLEAAAMGLRVFDDTRERVRLTPVVAA